MCFINDHYEEGVGTIYDSVVFYDNTLTRVHTILYPENHGELRLYDFNAMTDYNYIYITFTQGLFNNDDLFEFYVENEDGGGSIVQENGTVLWTWSPTISADYVEGGCHIYKWDNLYYLVTSAHGWSGSIYEEEYFDEPSKFYRIDRQTQTITQVAELSFNVFPTVADHNSDITVQLDEGTNAREIVVVDAMGREVKSVPVAEGQREVKVSTRDLHTGMGFVSDRKHGAVKIIVR